MKFSRNHIFTLMALLLLIQCAGCSDRDPASLEIARANIDPLVFDDATGADVYFQAFSGTYLEAVSLDSVTTNNSAKSLKITVPGEGSALGGYAGGVLTSVQGRDFADFNALTFYARSSVLSTLNVAGFGNDNTGTSLYEAGRSNIPLTTAWSFVVIPIPAPSKMISERGLFTFAEGFEMQHRTGHEIFVDDIQFANLDNITNPRPIMPSADLQYFTGATVNMGGTSTTFDIDGANVVVNHMPGYFDFESSDNSIAVVDRGQIKVVGQGQATVTATLEGTPVEGTVSLRGFLPPTAPAPTPAHAASDVISMFSDSYNDVAVDSWNTHWNWSTAENADYSVDGNITKMYTFLNFVGISFTPQTIDATEMTHLHLDVFAPEGTNFNVKIVGFSEDNGLLTGEAELTFNDTTTPAFVAGQWSSLEVPLADFEFAATMDHIGQIVFSTSDAQLLLVDNLYWHK